MSKELNPMEKFDFLLGNWKLDYRLPKSYYSEKDTGTGEGSFKRILNNQYVSFDYYANLSKSKGEAHAIFAWDKKNQIYKYWWFENSGEFMEATCDFLDKNTLCLNWHNSLFVQTFQRIENGRKIILQMKYPINKNEYGIILEVLFTKE